MAKTSLAKPHRHERDSGPVSVVLPLDLKARVRAEAERRGLKLSPAIRVLVGERVSEIEDAEGLSAAEKWQRAQAWASWERFRQGDRREASKQAIDAEFAAALGRRVVKRSR